MPAAYCRAYACFGIKVVVAPDIPNNWASLAPFRMVIPEGCILNAPRPYRWRSAMSPGSCCPT